MTQLLTDNEISTIVQNIDCAEVTPFDIDFARAVEAATIAAYEAKLIDQQENVVVIEVVPLNELFQRAIVKHLGPEALLHEKVSPYQIAERFFHAGYAVRHPAPIPEAELKAAIRIGAEYAFNLTGLNEGLTIDDEEIEECYKAMLVAASNPAPIPEGWQPIDTAPKDGLIDIFCNGRRYAQCHYDAICNEFRHITACGVLVILKKPTHWMPLPKPPMLAARSVE